MGKDFQYALRILVRSPGFTLVALLALALGIGANTAIFSVVNAVLLKPLPFADPGRLVMVYEVSPRTSRFNVANPINFLEWRDRNQSFERISAFIDQPMNLSGEGEPEQVLGRIVTGGYFEILGVTPQVGRIFTPQDDVPGAERVAILSHLLWQRRFGGDRSVIGRKITVNNRPVEVVGVMPPSFRFPNSRAEMWTPFAMDRARMQRTGRFLLTVARLKPGVTIDQARSDMDTLAARLREERPEFNAKWGATVFGLKEQAVRDVEKALLVLLGAVGFVLLIACANVANLMLVRATARERELAVRAALGASRGRIVRQLLVESVTLAIAGGTAGLLIAVWATRALVAMIPESIAVHNVTEVSLDRTVLGFTALLTLATGILFGLAPALRGGGELGVALREGSRAVAGGRSRLRGALVVAEVALSLILLVGAGLLIRSFSRLIELNPGFDPDKVLTMRLSTAGRFQDNQQFTAFVNQFTERVRQLPDVRAAGTIHFLPLTGLLSATGFWRADKPQPRPGEDAVTQTFVITPGYFAAMGIPMISGRLFDERDRRESPLVTIVNQELAHKFFPDENPIGKRLHIQWGRPQETYEIVGVVGSIRHRELERAPEPALFLSNNQEPNGFVNLVARTTGDPSRLITPIRNELRALDRDMAVSEVRTMASYMDLSMARPRFQTILIGGFAGLALALAAVGIFGVISYSVSQRTQELGIRRALGAGDSELLGMVLRQGMKPAAIGVAIGLAGAFGVTRFMETLLFETKPTDPATFAAVALVLLGVALAACWLPARRATRVDPMVALRYE